jgi:hypothetical protein
MYAYLRQKQKSGKNKYSHCRVLRNILFTAMEIARSVWQEALVTSTDYAPYTRGSQSLRSFFVRVQYGGVTDAIIRLSGNADAINVNSERQN